MFSLFVYIVQVDIWLAGFQLTGIGPTSIGLTSFGLSDLQNGSRDCEKKVLLKTNKFFFSLEIHRILSLREGKYHWPP
jgi:hypothetical protein